MVDKWKRWICTGCKLVVDSRDRPSCCGDVEEFSPLIHGNRLVGLSNAWISVWEKWRNHPLMEEARDEVALSGNYGADMVLNTFIEKLVDRVEAPRRVTAERMWRTLVRVDDVTQSGHLMVTVPAFSPNASTFVPVDDVPQAVLDCIDKLPTRLYARVNLGAGHIRDLSFEDWELPNLADAHRVLSDELITGTED